MNRFRACLLVSTAILLAGQFAWAQHTDEHYGSDELPLGDVTAFDLLTAPPAPDDRRNVEPTSGLRVLPPTGSTLFTGQRFDLRVETQLPSTVPPSLVSLTINGTDVTERFEAQILRQGSGLESGTPASPLLFGQTARNVSLGSPGLYDVTAVVAVGGGEVSITNRYEVADFAGGPTGEVDRIVFFLGDGMGQPLRTAARIYSRGVVEGRTQGRLFMDQADDIGLVMTPSFDSVITDSAPGMANYVTGVKQPNNALNVSVDNTPNEGADNPRVETLFEYLKRAHGWRTGIVSDAYITDATPGSAGAHVRSRGDTARIAQQFLDFYQDGTAQAETGYRALRALTQPIDVILGAGARYWLLDTNPDLEAFFQEGSSGRAANELDLFTDVAPALGYHTVKSLSELDAAPTDQPLLGLFGGDGRAAQSALDDRNIPAALDRLVARGLATIGGRGAGDPSLGLSGAPKGGTACGATVQACFVEIPSKSEMVAKAIEVLEGLSGGGGWILLVEQSHSDKLGHPLEYERAIYEVIELDNAIGAVTSTVDLGSSLVLVTADHAQPESIIGSVIPGEIRPGGATPPGDCFTGPIGSEGGVEYPVQLGDGSDPERPCILQDVVGTFNDGLFPTYLDDNGDFFPDDADPRIKLVVEQAGRPAYSQDYLTNPIPFAPTVFGEAARPNPERDPEGLLLTGNMASQGVSGAAPQGSVTVAPHSSDDVPLMSFGSASGLFAGVYENSDVSLRLVGGLSGQTDPENLVPPISPPGSSLVFPQLD